MIPGCQLGRAVQAARDSFRAENPGAGIIPVDENADGQTDYDAPDMDGDGRADKDASGKPLEIAGSRAGHAKDNARARAIDDNIAETFDLGSALAAGTPFGVILGIAGAFWGKYKPTKRFKDLVVAIDDAKTSDSPEDYITIPKKVLREALELKPGVIDAIEKIRKANKA